MRNFQILIGAVFVAISFVISATIFASAIRDAAISIQHGLAYMAELIR